MDIYQEIMVRGGTAWEIAINAGITNEIINKKRIQRDIYYQEFLHTKNLEIPNVRKVLANLSKKYKMAIVTTSRRVDFELIHKNRGLSEYMQFILCVEDYERAKPYPDPYLKGLALFKASNEQTIVVEDSQRGLISAVNANIQCVIVKNEFTKTHDFSKANYFIDSLEQLETILN